MALETNIVSSQQLKNTLKTTKTIKDLGITLTDDAQDPGRESTAVPDPRGTCSKTPMDARGRGAYQTPDILMFFLVYVPTIEFNL